MQGNPATIKGYVMDHKLILLPLLLLIAVFLFAGLPDDSDRHASSDRQPAERPSSTPVNSGRTDELADLRKSYALLLRETEKLEAKIESRNEHLSSYEVDTGHCADSRNRVPQDSPGVTVYLESSSTDVNSAPNWTAVSFRDAGSAIDGSKQAVIAIQQASLQAQQAKSGSQQAESHWQ
jgi:hypothetical protein